MRKSRKLHLWIGLITSVLILIEAVTGLLLSEPWLMGQTSRSEMRMPVQSAAGTASITGSSKDTAAAQTNVTNQDSAAFGAGDGVKRGSAANPNGAAPQAASAAQTGGRGANGQQSTSFVGIIHGLHEGRIGSTNVKWLADVAAVGLIILTLTGISLSIQTLRAQNKGRRRKTAA